MAYDVDNLLFSLSFMLCDIENTNTWTWFLQRVSEHATNDQHKVCIISYRHVGIKNVFATDFPDLHGVNRYCARHQARTSTNIGRINNLSQNFNK